MLPASTWSEKEGTVTNSERRISRVRAAIPAPGEARQDYQIAIDFGRVLEAKFEAKTGAKTEAKTGAQHQADAAPSAVAATLFPYTSSEEIWNEHRESTRGRDLDITGLSYQILNQNGPQQWPYPEGATTGHKRLYADGIFPTKTGRANFVNTEYQPVSETVTARYPFHLTTGRLRDQWHGMSRTGTVAQLYSHAPEPSVLMNPTDMERRFLKDGDLVHVSSVRGSQILPVKGSSEMRLSQSFIAMHWGEEYVSGRAHGGSSTYGVNSLTQGTFDPVSKQPELKHAAVKILKAELPWRFVVFGWVEKEQVLALQARLRPYMRHFDFASCTLFGREKTGVLLRAANLEAISPVLQGEIEHLFGLDAETVLRYDDVRSGNMRHLLVKEGFLSSIALAGDISAESWLREYLENQQPVAALGRLLLMSCEKAPQGMAMRGRIVCNCLNVAESEIKNALPGLAGAPLIRLEQLQAKLKCGTSCGSCVPELKQLIATVAVASTQSRAA